MTFGALSSSRLRRLSDAMQGYVDRGEVAGMVTLLSRRGKTFVEAFGVQDLEGGTPMAATRSSASPP
jgi:hypothetical protein